jgi:hypothetical protein
MADERKIKGLIVPGNIDLGHRPIVKNEDGTISTVLSGTFTDKDGNIVLLPHVIIGEDGKGRIVEPKEAWAHYKKTGEHLGIFDNLADAEAYSMQLHEDQANMYGGSNQSEEDKWIPPMYGMR